MMKHKEICNRSVVHCFTGNGIELQNYLKWGVLLVLQGGFVMKEGDNI